MTKKLIISSSLVGLSLTVFATAQQSPPGNDTPLTFTEEVAATGLSDVTLTNSSRLPITAYIVFAKYKDSPTGKLLAETMFWIDSDITDEEPLNPAASRLVHFGGIQHPGVSWHTEIVVEAVVLSDGSTFGSREWIDHIVNRRKTLHEHLGIVLSRLSEARRLGASRETLSEAIKTLKTNAMSSLPPNAVRRVIGQRKGIEGAYDLALINLSDGDDDIALGRLRIITDAVISRRQRLSLSKPAIGVCT